MGNNVFICHTYTGRKWLKPVIRKTQKGADDYANRMGYKYGETCNVRVEEYGHNDTDGWVMLHRCDWSA